MARVVLIEVAGATPATEAARVRAREDFAELLAEQMRVYAPWRRRTRRETETVALATIGGIADVVSHLVASGDLGSWELFVPPLAAWAVRALTPTA
jgi:hypothetical protein